jgi:hypothetical protein
MRDALRRARRNLLAGEVLICKPVPPDTVFASTL